MSNVYIVESQLVDHPEYETFVGVFKSFDVALSRVTDFIRKEVEDEDVEVVVKSEEGVNQYRVEVDSEEDYLVTYFITEHKVVDY